jgi:hypothetical protein
MTYRSVVVLLDHELLCAARSQVAIGLARQLDCHLKVESSQDLSNALVEEGPGDGLDRTAQRASSIEPAPFHL